MKCQRCIYMTLERHEDYMSQPMWYYGKCSKGCNSRPNEVSECSKFTEGEPKRVDCRSKGDLMFDI